MILLPVLLFFIKSLELQQILRIRENSQPTWAQRPSLPADL
jgi:hypothetical protein